MYAAYGKNTERAVRAFLASQPELKDVGEARSIQRIRDRKEHADKVSAAVEEANRLAKERLARERAEANAAIKKANTALAAFRKSNASQLSTVFSRICKATGYTKEDILSHRRNKNLVFARQAICYWAMRRTLLSLTEIGRKMGLDHTSVLHNRRVYPKKRAEMGRFLRAIR